MSKPSDYFDRGSFVPMRLVDEVHVHAQRPTEDRR